VSFADAYPVLVVSQSAIESLNSRLMVPASMQQFRPNIVINDVDAHAEDHWRRVRIGEVEFEAAKRCGRCVFTTVDPVSGQRDPGGEPLKTLKGYRRDEGAVRFGMYLVPRSLGIVREGDRIEILD